MKTQRQPGKAVPLEATSPSALTEVRISGSLDALEIEDIARSIAITLQYQEGGKWIDHMKIVFRGGPVPKQVSEFGGDPTAVIATTKDVRALAGRPTRLQSDISKTLNASFDITWL